MKKKILLSLLACLTVGFTAIGMVSCVELPDSGSESESLQESLSESTNEQTGELLFTYITNNEYSVDGIGEYFGTDIIIPSTYNGGTVTQIGRGAFGSSGITSVSIPDTVTHISENAFIDCDNLTEIIIPDSVKRIETGVFDNCSNLTKVKLGKNLEFIGFQAFWYCEKLENITIPENVTMINDEAFQMCYGLKNVTFEGTKLETIGIEAFSSCTSLTSVELPVGLKTLEGGAFGWCDNLESVMLPNSLSTIEYNAFYSCDKLSGVTIPDSVTSIGDWAFAETSLTEIFISDKVTDLGHAVFAKCNELANIIIDVNNPNYQSIDGVVYTKDGTCLIQYAPKRQGVLYTVLDGVQKIGEGAFFGTQNLQEIVLPRSLTTIEYAAFQDGCKLEKVYYKGTADDWSLVTFEQNGANNGNIHKSTKYFYTEEQPIVQGNYWCYDENNEMKIW